MRTFLSLPVQGKIILHFLQLFLMAFMTFSPYAYILLDEPKNSKQSVYTAAIRRRSWTRFPSRSERRAIYPVVFLNCIRPETQAATNPYSCDCVFTNRLIFVEFNANSDSRRNLRANHKHGLNF